eukprot:579244-Alexandrium_andersonii.AAC.1
MRPRAFASGFRPRHSSSDSCVHSQPAVWPGVRVAGRSVADFPADHAEPRTHRLAERPMLGGNGPA